MENQKNYPLRLSQKLYDEIEKRAEKNRRSVNSEIVAALESTVSIPMIGTIKDGVITIKEELDRR